MIFFEKSQEKDEKIRQNPINFELKYILNNSNDINSIIKQFANNLTPIKNGKIILNNDDLYNWIEIDIQKINYNLQQNNLYLSINYPVFENISIYKPKKNGENLIYEELSLQLSDPLTNREILNTNYIFKIPNNIKNNDKIYLKIKTIMPISISPEFISEANFDANNNNKNIIYIISIISILSLAIYHFFMWILSKEKFYIIYVVYVIASILKILSSSNLGFEHLWPNMYIFQIKSYQFFNSFVIVVLYVFSIIYLNIQIKKYLNSLFIGAYLFLIYMILSIFDFSLVFNQFINILSYLAVIHIFILTIKEIKHNKTFLFLLFSLIILFISNLATDFYVNKNNYFSIMFLCFIVIINTLDKLVLAFALADKINVYKQNQAEAERNSIMAKQKQFEIEQQKIQIDLNTKIRQNELAQAEAIQQGLLPKRSQIPSYFKVACKYIPTVNIGGDWYWFVENKNSCYTDFFIGDVTGHGIPAVLVTGVINGTLYSVWRESLNLSTKRRLEEYIRHSNKQIVRSGRSIYFMTLIALSINSITGHVEFISAAHCPFLWCSPSKKQVKSISKISYRLGTDTEDIMCGFGEFDMLPGDFLFLYTDGLVENKGPDEKILSFVKIKKILLENIDKNIEELENIIYEAAEHIWDTVPAEDDLTTMFISWPAKINED